MKIDEKTIRKIISESIKNPNSSDDIILEQGLKSAFGGVFKPLTDFYGKINDKGASLASKAFDGALGVLEKEMRLNQIAGDGNLNLKGNPEHQEFYIATIGDEIVELLNKALAALKEAGETSDWTPDSSEKSDVSDWQDSSGKSSGKLFTALGIMVEVATQMKDFSSGLSTASAAGRQIELPNEAAAWIDRFVTAMGELKSVVKDPQAVVKGKLDAMSGIVEQIGQENAGIKNVMKDSAKEVTESLSTILGLVRVSLNETNFSGNK